MYGWAVHFTRPYQGGSNIMTCTLCYMKITSHYKCGLCGKWFCGLCFAECNKMCKPCAEANTCAI